MDKTLYEQNASAVYIKGLMKMWHFLWEELQNNKVEFSKSNSDGRINSVMDEETIINLLIAEFPLNIERADDRCWHDMVFVWDNFRYYINIKCSTGQTDNALNKKAIVYSLSTLDPDAIAKSMNINKMVTYINDNPKETRSPSKEYYYLYVDKIDGSVILKSLLDIQHFVANSINILQINWKKEKRDAHQFNSMDINEARHNVLSVVTKSIKTYFDGCSILLEQEF